MRKKRKRGGLFSIRKLLRRDNKKRRKKIDR